MTQGARPHPDTLAAVKAYRRGGKTQGQVAKRFKIDRTTLCKALGRYPANGRK